MLKKDSYVTGLLLGTLTPILAYGIFFGIDMLMNNFFGRHLVKAPHYLMLLSVTPNLLWLRYYMGKLKFAKTGLAILLLTMIFVLLYFYKYFENPQ